MIKKILFVWEKEKTFIAPKCQYSRGVTLIEMVVVISILAFVSSIILINHQSFNSRIVLGSLAYDVALAVREAQVFGLAVREESVATSFDTGYGVHFDATLENTFILFADADTDFQYDPGERVLREFVIGRGTRVSDFCATPISPAAPEKCKSTDGLTFLDISFQRPDPESYFRTNVALEKYKSARIILKSAQGLTREVNILATGQIEVL